MTLCRLKTKTWLILISWATGIALAGLLPLSEVRAQEIPELDCLIEPQMTVELASPVDGVIETMLVDKGDRVSKGQVVAKLQSSVEEAQLRLARERAARTDEVQYYQANSAFTQRRFERLKTLPKDDLVTRHEVDETETQATLARLQLTKARTDKHIAELEQQQVQALMEQRAIRSPIDGVVIQRYLQPGESTENKAIMKLAQINPLKVEAYAPASLVGLVINGTQGELTLEVPTASPLRATVSMVDPVVDASSGSFGIRMALPNPDNRPLSGLKCKIRLLADKAPAHPQPTSAQSQSPSASEAPTQ